MEEASSFFFFWSIIEREFPLAERQRLARVQEAGSSAIDQYASVGIRQLERYLTTARASQAVVKVEWDLDDGEWQPELPPFVGVPISVLYEGGVADYLSDHYGWCVRAWAVHCFEKG